jgi:2Fe-2S ferredoxin
VIKIIVANREGVETEIKADAGTSVMEAARDNGIDEILALCGGSCACATCHVYVDEAWFEKTGSMSDDENELLDNSPHRRGNSRLGCQISLSDDLAGLRVTVAPED